MYVLKSVAARLIMQAAHSHTVVTKWLWTAIWLFDPSCKVSFVSI